MTDLLKNAQLAVDNAMGLSGFKLIDLTKDNVISHRKDFLIHCACNSEISNEDIISVLMYIDKFF